MANESSFYQETLQKLQVFFAVTKFFEKFENKNLKTTN
jgi:hypothetical protein